MKLGFYPVVNRAAWLRRLLPLGVKTIQLRVKDLSGEALHCEVKEAITLAHRHGARLFINDHWELAIGLGAYGVHLGQGDLDGADLNKIARAGLRLGISTHDFSEVQRGTACQPSYLAIGPIFPTTLKQMPYEPQGIESLRRWRALVPYPLVAIGGMKLAHVAQARQAGADGIAVVSAITAAKDPESEASKWLKLC